MKWLLVLMSLGCFQLSAQVKPDTARKPFVLGEVRHLYSGILKEDRTLNIYLPEGYNPRDTVRYPVIYLLDGSADEDFIHIVGLVQFNSFEWVHRWPRSIVVGIGTVDRRRDYTFPTSVAADKKAYPTTGGSARFIQFLEQELQPFIAKTYQTNTSRTLIGQSLGGLLGTEILFKKPALFNTYIIVSPSLWWDNGSLLAQPTQPVPAETRIYIGVGKEGLTPSNPPRVMEVDANLLAEKVRAGHAKTLFDYLPDENHATILHQAVQNAFILLNK